MTTEVEAETASSRPLFIARLILGFIQGLLLYFLYHAAEHHSWPATELTTFAPLAMTALFVPTLISQAMGTMRVPTLLIWGAAMIGICCGLAIYDRLEYADVTTIYSTAYSNIYPRFAVMFFGFAILFIAQSLIAAADSDESFIASYNSYFDAAWKLGVQLALAHFFVGVFWGVLWLGAVLFNLIKLDFFSTLIQHDWFAIPATALATATAIHLTDVRARMVAGIRTVVLTMLGWLLPLMALLAAGFLGGLFVTGFAPLWQTRAATAGLLSAAATLIFLVNAAYQNGEGRRVLALRLAEVVAAFALLPLVAIAASALSMRVGQYDWTVERINSLACIIIAACYALGYVVAAILSLLGRDWMGVLRPVNIGTSFVVLAVLLALFSPIADPAKISVGEQVERLHAGKITPAKFDYAYLRFQSGEYGMTALKVLAKDSNPQIRGNAQHMLQQRDRFLLPLAPQPPLAVQDMAANITVYPKGKTLPPSVLTQKWNDVTPLFGIPPCLRLKGIRCDAILVDLNGDGRDEIIFVENNSTGVSLPFWFGQVLSQDSSGHWISAGSLPGPHCTGELEALRDGRFKVVPPPKAPVWNQIQIDGRILDFSPMRHRAAPGCATGASPMP